MRWVPFDHSCHSLLYRLASNCVRKSWLVSNMSDKLKAKERMIVAKSSLGGVPGLNVSDPKMVRGKVGVFKVTLEFDIIFEIREINQQEDDAQLRSLMKSKCRKRITDIFSRLK